MRRDSIFFRLFQQAPTLLFELLDKPPDNAECYRFDSVAVKETKFEIDGVFLPPSGKRGTVFFAEVQFQLDEQLYERLWSESSRYFYQNRQRFSDWQAAVIYPSRKQEQKDLFAHRSLLNGGQVYRVYLNELAERDGLSLGLSVLLLTTKTQRQMPKFAKALLVRTAEEVDDPGEKRAIIEMISTIVVYKFTHLSRQEVEAMLETRLKETRVYQEAKQEGIEQEREQGIERQRSLVLRQLTHCIGKKLPKPLRSRVEGLALDDLEDLGVALLDFGTIADLESWLDENG
jgi:predicted transposase/invertase (TIGR01784 family)